MNWAQRITKLLGDPGPRRRSGDGLRQLGPGSGQRRLCSRKCGRGAGADPWVPLKAEREALVARLSAMTDEDLTRVVEREGKPPRTARRMLRRTLEHEWEHLLELQARL